MKVTSLSSFPDFIPSGRSESVHLDKNENPFAVPPSPLEEIREAFLNVPMNRYPDQDYRALKESLSDYTGYSSEKIVLGNGGDEVLWILYAAFVEAARPVLTLSPCFSEYDRLCSVFRTEQLRLPLDCSGSGFALDGEKLLKLAKERDPALIIIDSPNNPSGMTIEKDIILELVYQVSCPVIIDEAYGEFADTTILEKFRGSRMPSNLFILKTLSKAWGLAGIRLGYGLCEEEVANRFNSIRSPFNISVLTEEVARVMLRYREWMESRVYSIKFMRDRFIQSVNTIHGWKAFPSDSNFVLVNTCFELPLVKTSMEENQIELRYPELPEYDGNWIRISVGKEEEMRRLLDIISSIGK
ncbi:MAG TPA: histidinol-phosphate transaminase [Synergistales bacterium]|nr:histidinol-phosphate transaminase [Synergistales bacterium]